jgi:hypothetical protein
MGVPKKNARTQSAAATLSSVKKEMAKPRVAASVRQAADTSADRGPMAVVSNDETSRRVEVERILLDYGKKVGS